jgi:hypothetical protein
MVTTKAASQRWRSLISSYHYLGYTPFAGAQLRYLIETSVGTIGPLASRLQHGPVRHVTPISVGTGLPGKLASTSWSETPAS